MSAHSPTEQHNHSPERKVGSSALRHRAATRTLPTVILAFGSPFTVDALYSIAPKQSSSSSDQLAEIHGRVRRPLIALQHGF